MEWALVGSKAEVDETSAAQGEAGKKAGEKGPAKGESEHEGYFKIINFLLLLAALVYLLRKPLRSFLADRSENIHSALEEGSRALEHSQAQLGSIEEKLKHLQEEISGFKTAAASEMEAERQRLHQAADDEAERILEAARAQIENSARAARLELKTYVAQQVLELAETILRQRLDETAQQQLVYRFVQEVKELKNGSASRS
jgi:F-type H+-transporting ATPase subunit b